MIIFSSFALVFFLSRHFWVGRRIRRERNNLPLVIGGWGTRGKSGTERLKAAVFHAKGLGVVSKTTGCEAMFIHGPPFMSAKEMFLFRPYDKATIWEQSDLVAISQKLDCQVFLWECMALSPSYVHLLQRDWMRDDFSTITNAYPDHEDLQGPAGINIPEVIAKFIPEKSKLISSEEQMAPIFRAEAKKVDTSLDEVGWLEAGLITPDILTRFPYAEHPNNIALVTRLCEKLGLPPDETLMTMADNVIPDIGVLKIYPEANLNGRWLSFINGMSANERLGCLGNWKRAGFADHNIDTNPEVWITTVVNNRADRVARSKVFARLLVQDVQADRHILVGGNLAGLQGYIDEELNSWLSGLTLWPTEGVQNPVDILQKQSKIMRIPNTEAAVVELIAAMLKGCDLDDGQATKLAALWQEPEKMAEALNHLGIANNEEINIWAQRFSEQWQAFDALQTRLSTHPEQNSEIDILYREQLRQWFLDRIIVVWDYHCTGNDIVRNLVEHTPPGFHNKIMGMQNIKGTGLDFVYRGQAWDQCNSACTDILSNNPSQFSAGLRTMTEFRDYGPLCEDLVKKTVAKAKTVPEAQNEKNQAALVMILSNLDLALTKDLAASSVNVAKSSRLDWLIDGIEAFFDAGDAIKRRKIANRIYKDLMSERISRQRASELLGDLIKRQKGGWFKKKVLGFFEKS